MIYFCSSRDLNWESNSIFHSFEFQKSHWWVFLISSWKGGMNKINYIWILPVRRRHSSCQFLFCLEHIAVIDGSFEKKENKKVFVENEAAAIEGEKEALKKNIPWTTFMNEVCTPTQLSISTFQHLSRLKSQKGPVQASNYLHTYQNIVNAIFHKAYAYWRCHKPYTMYFLCLSVIHQTRWCHPFFEWHKTIGLSPCWSLNLVNRVNND